MPEERQLLLRFGGFGPVALSNFPAPVRGRSKDASWQALGGLGDDSRTDGLGVGGGVDNLGTFLFDAATVIAHNHAATSYDDCFGC
jgi:hypothetical protein